jgi:ribosome-binding protein aMBF1 (putative translation factor)
MIKNERQYRITKAQAAKFRLALTEMRAQPRRRVALDGRLARAEHEALASQLDDLVREIKDYERLKGGRTRKIRIGSLEDLPAGLIRARIAAHLSQKALAARVGLKEQQIQRYEAEDYASANLGRLSEIARALGVTVREEIELPRRRASTRSE